MNAIQAYVLCKKYVQDSLIGMGALKGAPCEVQSVNKIDGVTTVTLKWTDTTGTDHTTSFDIDDGVGVVNAYTDEDSHLIFVMSDGTEIDCGVITTDGYTKEEIGDITQLPIAGKDVIENISDIYDELIHGGSGNAKMLTGTLLAANWVGNTQTVSVTGLEGTENGVIGLSNIATDEEIAAARLALITVYGVNGSNVTFKCEQAPSIDINFSVLIPGGGSGGGGDAELERDVTSNIAVGAIASGTKLNQGTTFTEFVEKLLVSEIAPTINFSISKSGNVVYGSSYIEKLTINVTNMGSAKSIDTIEWYEGSTLVQTDTIESTTAGSWSYTMATATTDTTTFKAIVKYKKSNNTQTTSTKTASINFYYNKFYGSVASLTPSEADVTALTTALGTAKGGTYTFAVTAARIAYAYPSSLGALTSIKDGNGFSLFDSFTRTTETYTQNGISVSYYLYVLTDPTTVSGYSVTFA